MNIENLEHWHFDLTEESANHLLNLVLEGKKRATSSSYPGYLTEGEDIPKVGDMSVITDWDGNPRCVIRDTKVQIIPFKDITFDLAGLEGEDENLESWRTKHEAFFREEGSEVGYTFSPDMKVVFEEFEVVEIL